PHAPNRSCQFVRTLDSARSPVRCSANSACLADSSAEARRRFRWFQAERDLPELPSVDYSWDPPQGTYLLERLRVPGIFDFSDERGKFPEMYQTIFRILKMLRIGCRQNVHLCPVQWILLQAQLRAPLRELFINASSVKRDDVRNILAELLRQHDPTLRKIFAREFFDRSRRAFHQVCQPNRKFNDPFVVPVFQR